MCTVWVLFTRAFSPYSNIIKQDDKKGSRCSKVNTFVWLRIMTSLIAIFAKSTLSRSRRKDLFGERNYTLADKGRPLSIWETRLTRFQLSISKLKLKSELAGLDLSWIRRPPYQTHLRPSQRLRCLADALSSLDNIHPAPTAILMCDPNTRVTWSLYRTSSVLPRKLKPHSWHRIRFIFLPALSTEKGRWASTTFSYRRHHQHQSCQAKFINLHHHQWTWSTLSLCVRLKPSFLKPTLCKMWSILSRGKDIGKCL
jgi:hypothetical protein